MSTPYTPVATYHPQINVTVDGDLADSTEFNTPYEQCADNGAYCKSILDPFVTGGTVSPAGTLTFACSIAISGANSLSVTGGATVFGGFEVHGATFLDTTVDIVGVTTVGATITAAGTITSTGGDLVCVAGTIAAVAGNIQAVAGDVSAGGNVNAGGDANITGSLVTGADATVGGNLEVDGTTSFVGHITSTAAFDDSVTLFKPLLLSSLGQLTLRRTTGLSGTSGVHYGGRFNWINWFSLTTIPVTAIIDNETTQPAGSFILFTMYASTQVLTIDLPGAPGAFVFAGDSAAHSGIALYDGTVWTAMVLT